MKFKLLVFILLVILSSCAGGPSPSVHTAVPREKITKVISQSVFCPTQNEEARLLYNRALNLTSQGNLNEAVLAYRKAIALDGGYCDAMDNMGQLLRRQGKIDEAIFWYKQSLEVFPNNPVAHTNLAVAYSFQGKYREAISEHQIVVKIDPDDPEGYYGLGTVYLQTNELKLASENFKKAEELYARRSSPIIADARYALGIVYYSLKDFKTSKFYLEQVYSEKQNDLRANYILGFCYLVVDNDPGRARPYFKKARDLGAKIPPELEEKIAL